MGFWMSLHTSPEFRRNVKGCRHDLVCFSDHEPGPTRRGRRRSIQVVSGTAPASPGESNFVGMFRSCAPYIRSHHGTTVVIHLPGESLPGGRQDSRAGVAAASCYEGIMDEVALLSLLQVRIVLVLGCGPQVDTALQSRGLPDRRRRWLHHLAGR
ncbi:unnamed protein product, partial [Discosporangium mesarthrocarpum]